MAKTTFFWYIKPTYLHWIHRPMLNVNMLKVMAEIKLQCSSECYNQRKAKNTILFIKDQEKNIRSNGLS